MPFKFYKQMNAMDCGPTCLRMISKFYGKHYNVESLRVMSGFSKQGVSMLGISKTAEKIGFRTRGIQISFEGLQDVILPAILHWDQKHFVVLVNIDEETAEVADPAFGIIKFRKKEFLSHWQSSKTADKETVGSALLFEPTPKFYEKEGEPERKLNWEQILQYFKQCRKQFTQVFMALIVGFFFQLAFPFLTQSMVDKGINGHDLHYITLVLIAQLTLTFSTIFVNFISSRIQLRISTIINLSILSDFWIKLTRLPISYFDTRHLGDTLQRINDNRQVQGFITGVALNNIFSIVRFIVFTIILNFYSVQLFLVFIGGNLLNLLWVRLFLPVRRRLNYESFDISAKENSATLQLVQGMPEIKLHNAEELKRWEWENLQAKKFNLAFKSLNYNQFQSLGATFINQGKDVLITFMVARLTLQGELTLGTMLAVQYIIGQLSGPVSGFISLLQSSQDAKISLERLNEIHSIEDEEPADRDFKSSLPECKTISINNLTFSYPANNQKPVLKNISFEVPEGKVTAIVGMSGSGKTTLLKLLVKAYSQYEGEIRIGNSDFRHISPSFWRNQCGCVLLDGYIFNDTIARNIALSDERVDYERLIHCCRITNILSFIENLPNGINTKLGGDGVGISQGQKQRILIARAIYKDPQYLFFDEATNALDANNEKTIVENLSKFFLNRTVIIVAHRLSTVKNADKIIVLKDGEIAEEGTHKSLTELRGQYYELVKNQLELGN